MEILQHADISYDYRTYREFWQFSLFKIPVGILLLTAIYLISAVVIILSAAMMILFSDIDVFLIAAAALMLICCAVFTELLYVEPYRLKKPLSRGGKESYSLDFFEDSFAVDTGSEGTEGIRNEYGYSAIEKVYELPEVFYIYTTSAEAFILPKSAVTKDSAAELKVLLKTKAQNNYKAFCRE